MSDLIRLPEPSGAEADWADAQDSHDDHDQRAPGGQEGEYRRKPPRVPTTDECLRALAQLPGLVAMKLIQPSQANAIRATYREILQYHQANRAPDGRKGLTDANVLELMRKDPQVMSMLEPLLTDEQITMVMNGAKDGSPAQA